MGYLPDGYVGPFRFQSRNSVDAEKQDAGLAPSQTGTIDTQQQPDPPISQLADSILNANAVGRDILMSF
jgi:hypothetical protein